MTVEFTADVIRHTTFREHRRGYHPAEVDAFVQLMAGAVDVLQTRLTDETERALKAEGALEQNSDTDDSVRRTLVLAQRTAALAVAEATDDATRIRDEAGAEAEAARAAAEAEAHRLVSEAAESAALVLADASRQRDEAESECAELREVSRAEIAEAEANSAATIASAESNSARSIAEAEMKSATSIAEAKSISANSIAEAEMKSANAIATARRDADATMARRAEEGRLQLDRNITALTAQRAELRTQIKGLSDYLATERARVLAVLTTARDDFGRTLMPSPRPEETKDAEPNLPAYAAADVDPPMAGDDLSTPRHAGHSEHEEPEKLEEEKTLDLDGSPDAVGELAPVGAGTSSVGDDQGSPEPGGPAPSLLFTLEHQLRPGGSRGLPSPPPGREL